jgi:hypothetical protein
LSPSFCTNRDILQVWIIRTQSTRCGHRLHIIGMNAPVFCLLGLVKLQHSVLKFY